MKRALLICSFIGVAVAPVTVSFTEYGGVDQNRRSVFQDRTLTPSNVTAATFGKLHTVTVDGGQIYAQPLFVQGVTIGTGTFDLMIVSTMGNTLWAIDANSYATVWKLALSGTWSGYPNFSGSENNFYQNTPMGCVSTPAVDRVNGLLYSVCPDASGSWTLRKINVANGTVLGQVDITGQFPGTGDTGDTIIGGQLQFKTTQHLNRPGLTLANGNVYIAFSSFSDEHPWHGWVFSYSQSSLSQAAVWCSTPNGYGGGIWLTGDAPAVDNLGNLYLATGNGDYDGATNFGNSVVKLSPSLAVLDWFTPSNWATLKADDFDVTSGQIMLSDDGYLFAGDKNFREYVMSQNCLGRLQGTVTCSGSQQPQLVTVASGACPLQNCGIYGGLFFNHQLFIPVNANSIYAFTYSSGQIATSPFATTSMSFGHPGARIAMSANGVANSVLWAVTATSSAFDVAQPGILRAFNTSTLAELYNSTQTPGDTLGTFAKMDIPVIVNGRVWVSTGDGTIVVYGLK